MRTERVPVVRKQEVMRPMESLQWLKFVFSSADCLCASHCRQSLPWLVGKLSVGIRTGASLAQCHLTEVEGPNDVMSNFLLGCYTIEILFVNDINQVLSSAFYRGGEQH